MPSSACALAGLIAADSLPASISLSNLGQSGIDRFEAIINPGQASILAVGRSHDRVIARGGAPVCGAGIPPDLLGGSPADRRKARRGVSGRARGPDRVRPVGSELRPLRAEPPLNCAPFQLSLAPRYLSSPRPL